VPEGQISHKARFISDFTLFQSRNVKFLACAGSVRHLAAH
jgi:hypothetical protein